MDIKEERKEQFKDMRELRKRTGVNLIDCKLALEKTHYMMDEAEKWLADYKERHRIVTY